MADFPILDAPRTEAKTELFRTVIDELGSLEAYDHRTDYWTYIPIRTVHDQGHGFAIELGPYTLDATDIQRLREAINSYDLANHGPTIRRIK